MMGGGVGVVGGGGGGGSGGGRGYGASGLAGAGMGGMMGSSDERVLRLVQELSVPEQREMALLELSKKRETFSDLAPLIWNSYGTIASLLEEIVAIYPLLSPPALTAHASNRVCNALALLQCVASHSETRGNFLQGHIPLFLYPFLNTVSKTRPFEYLRLTSLGVIGALVKMDDPDVISFLLSTEIIPLCLRIMETGSELSKTVATFIVQKILLDEHGLNYICATAERFYAVSTVLSSMVEALREAPSSRLLKHIVRCYLRLSDNPRAREALRICLPEPLRNQTFSPILEEDTATRKWLTTLLYALGGEQNPS
ncbi:Cell differentiation protein RCD1-like [Porphyridium purpureum]|uniref:Cell differentiation protein RCD1-like n=1 Tax=Porphyridium purpureum TaxID=35688 RepID=A0A5J4YM52_PORPP|nr:Cell differentiation protein RCD1-like [Porphyridium purpureum]|eukprot:POR6885..scf244_11